MRVPIPLDIEDFRDLRWRREGSRQVDSVLDVEQFVHEVGFTACLTDSRRPGASLYIAVCGRRDAVLPRHVQKDPEAAQTWRLKDEVIRRGKVYYGKLARGRATFVAPRMIPCFRALWGIRRSEEKTRLSAPARAILKALRKEWEMGTADLRDDAKIGDRQVFLRALDELQAAMIVIPAEVLYSPKFTYLWTVAEGRFPDEFSAKTVSREVALREVARCFLTGAGLTVRGELARVTGLSRTDAGLGNHALVAAGDAERLAPGTYQLIPLGRP